MTHPAGNLHGNGLRAMMMRALGGMAALSLAVLALPAAGEDKPLWEAGLGVGVVSFPEYRGSARQRAVALPMPYFIYRGKILKADRNGLRGKLFDNERAEINLSFAASLPVESDSKGQRRGMPDLQPTVEVGPSLDVNLWRGDAGRTRLDLRLPVRAAYTARGGVARRADFFPRAQFQHHRLRPFRLASRRTGRTDFRQRPPAQVFL